MNLRSATFPSVPYVIRKEAFGPFISETARTFLTYYVKNRSVGKALDGRGGWGGVGSDRFLGKLGGGEVGL